MGTVEFTVTVDVTMTTVVKVATGTVASVTVVVRVLCSTSVVVEVTCTVVCVVVVLGTESEKLAAKVVPVSPCVEEFTLVGVKSLIALMFVGKLREENKLERREYHDRKIIIIAHWHGVSSG